MNRLQASRVFPAPRVRGRQSSRRVSCVHGSERGSGAVKFLVSVSTEALRLFGAGQNAAPRASSPLDVAPPRSMEEFMAKLSEDYNRMYFISGELADELYVDRCRFSDPTISFEGLQLYKKNLRLLIPFLISPSIRLKGMREVVGVEGRRRVRAAWTLSTGLKLPWRPYVFVNGTTDYDLIDYQIVEHVERWDISPWEAVLMVLGLFKNTGSAESVTGK